MKKLNEDNIRERVLTEGEFEQLFEFFSSLLREMTLVAYYLTMRQGEILSLTWNHIDFKRNLIILSRGETKTGFKKRISINPIVQNMLDG